MHFTVLAVRSACASLMVSLHILMLSSAAAQNEQFNIAYSGPLELTLSRPQDSDLPAACPLETPISIRMDAELGTADRQIIDGNFHASSAKLNGAVVNLDLQTERFEFSGPVPLNYAGTFADGQFVFWDSQSALTCFGEVLLIPGGRGSLPQQAQQPGTSEDSQVEPTSDVPGSEFANGPSVWTGSAVPQDIVKNYGEFCDVRRPSKLTLEIDGQTVSGQLVRAADGKVAKLHGKLRGNVVTGQLADTNSFMSKFMLSARMEGNAISGTLAATAWNSCTAKFTVSTDDPRYRKGGA